MIRLGKLPAKIDKRTIPLSRILNLKVLPEYPASYDLHAVYGVKDNFVFRNAGEGALGDCVKAARAHQTLVFEAYEQGCQIVITDQEVVDEYFIETGGADNGLVLLYSLNDWRNNGWVVGGRVYTIYAFASLSGIDEFKHTVHLLGGPNFGVKIYETDIEQFNAGQPWHLTSNDGRLLGGHGLYAPAYTVDSATCMTWGKRQDFTFEWFQQRSDEAYAIVDNRDDWVGDSPVNVEALDALLREITGETQPGGCLWSIVGSLIAKVCHARVHK